MYVQRSLDRGYGRAEVGVSRSKVIRIKMKKEFKKFIENAKHGNEKDND